MPRNDTEDNGAFMTCPPSTIRSSDRDKPTKKYVADGNADTPIVVKLQKIKIVAGLMKQRRHLGENLFQGPILKLWRIRSCCTYHLVWREITIHLQLQSESSTCVQIRYSGAWGISIPTILWSAALLISSMSASLVYMGGGTRGVSNIYM